MAKLYVEREEEVIVHEIFTLELTKHELLAMRAVFNRVGGSVTTSPRRDIDTISKAVDNAFPEAKNLLGQTTVFR